MCWSIPGKIVEIKGSIGTVEISGIRKKVMLSLVENISRGDYVLVHAGYAIEKVDPAKAEFTIDFFKWKVNR